MLDLRETVVVTPADLSVPERNAVRMLVEEVEKRSQIRWDVTTSCPDRGGVVGVGQLAALGPPVGCPAFAGRLPTSPPPGPEGYRLEALDLGPGPAVLVGGSDARGVLFGVGHLLRLLRMSRHRIELPENIRISTAPAYPLRGHQLGYRPKTNSYDAWTLPMWEQYIRDLAVFGANAVELIPPRSDDDADSPHFPLPPMETMVGMSRILDEYGLDVWIWYPAMDPDYSDRATVRFAIEEWAEVFRRLPRIDAVFVPGGDPGHTHPAHLMPLLEQQAASLRGFHPDAQMWVAPQGFSQEWLDEFIGMLRDEPAWLTGVVFGPQIRVSLPRLRELVPERYPIRHYPDITHSRQCQYPVPQWDLAYALTEAREGINARPLGMAQIFRLLQPHTNGFITYSEGCNDDVNKCVWSALGWDPDVDVVEVLREYSRYYIGDAYADPFAQGVLALERNWEGPLLTNAGVYTSLQQFQALEREALPHVRLNWRFQQALYRAYYDAYVRARLLYETGLEEQAMERLRAASETGARVAMDAAQEILDQAVTHRVARDWRARVFELAEALFQSIRMQLSVDRYQAIAVGRGANLDTVDVALNNRLWLKEQFAAIRSLPEEAERLRLLNDIVDWTNPGPGGFYDDLGSLTNQPHLVSGTGVEQDPAFLQSPLISFYAPEGGRTSWRRHAEALIDSALRMHYAGLDTEARYRVRVVYGSETTRWNVRLTAGEGELEVHPWMKPPAPAQPVTFDIPEGAVREGTLTLTWRREPGRGGNGRGCQVAEVWLLRSG